MLRLCVVVLGLSVPAVAWPHAALVKSAPAQRAVLYQTPAKIRLWFNERVEARYSSFTLSDAAGKPVEVTDIAVAPDGPKCLTGTVKPLPAGRYTVKYRVLSTDGHIVQNQFYFTIKQ